MKKYGCLLMLLKICASHAQVSSVSTQALPPLTFDSFLQYKQKLRNALTLQLNDHWQISVDKLKLIAPLSEIVQLESHLQPKPLAVNGRGYGLEVTMRF